MSNLGAGAGSAKVMREVVHIETREGARGGEMWWLKLTCGHHVLKYKGVLRAFRLFADRPKFAPKRMKCTVCTVLACK